MLAEIDVVSRSWKVTDEHGVTLPGSIEFSVPALPKWIPVGADHPLQGLGQRVWAQVNQGDGWRTWGWFRLDRPKLAGRVVQSKGRGLLREVQRFRLTETVQTSAADTRIAVLRSLTAGVLPVAVDGVADSAMSTATFSEDRLAAFWSIVESWPARAFMRDQAVVIAPAWDDSNPGAPTVDLVDGEGGTLVDLQPSDDDADPYNAYWVSTVPSGSDPAMVRSWKMPDGPMRWGGPYGYNPGFYSSPLLTTEAQLLAVAEKMTRREIAVGMTVTFTALPSTRASVGDVATVRSTRRAIDGVGRITTLQLTATALTGTVAMF